MSKRPNLAAVAAAAGSTRHQDPGPGSTTQPEVREQAAPRTRVGTKQIAAHFPVDVAWLLRARAVQRKTTVQNLMAEALNDLFAKHGKPELAPLDRARG